MLPSAWYDVTESRSGRGNSPNSVNMYLGHAAGQLNVTKELRCYQKNFVPFINNNNRIQYNSRMSLNC